MWKTKRINRGELPMYHAVGTHEAIISPERFDLVQKKLERRAERYAPGRQTVKPYPFTSLITCAKCGCHYSRKTTAGGHVWICRTFNRKGKAFCP